MEDLESVLKTKIETRLFAKENMGKNDGKAASINGICGDSISEEEAKFFEELNNNLEEADMCKYQDGYWIITGSKTRVFIKKVLRKLLKIIYGWYIFTVYGKQNHYNGKIVNALTRSRDILQNQHNEINGIKNKLQLLEAKIEGMTSNENTQLLFESRIGDISAEVDYIFNKFNIKKEIDNVVKENFRMDYFDFENKFRGSREEIKQRQSRLIDYFRINGGGSVLDLGCGRGEFLELLYDNGISGYGVDCYKPFVDYCTDRGFEVLYDDAILHLNKLENTTLGGIYLGQVAEHMPWEYLNALVRLAYKKLKPGCCFILETQNPENITTYRNFYLDADHVKPVHYLNMEYLFKDSNYQSVIRIPCEYSKVDAELKKIESNGDILNLDEVNNSIERANELIFSECDYVLVAIK